MNDDIIQVSSLSKVYKDAGSKVVALDNVSFNIKRGEGLAIVGPSGSGKTTLLEIIAGLNNPSKGRVVINGRNIHKGSDREISQFRNKTLGFVFQMMHLQDYFSALENITLPLIASGVNSKEARDRARELLKNVDLEARANHYPKQLSGGEMQRIALARALANKPQIIMADEPTGKLDRQNAEKVMEIFDDITHQGVSIILVTHDEKIAKTFKRNIHMDHGKII